MSSKGTARRNPGENTSVSPDSYHIEYVKLTTTGDDARTVDITRTVQKIDITEDMTQPYVESVIFIADSVGLFHNLNLTGSEIIDLKIRRNPTKGSEQDKQKLELRLKIIEIYGLARRNVTRQGFNIRCASEHLYTNQTKILQRPFRNTIGRLVKDILEKDLRVDPERIYNINTSSKSIIQGIYPSLRPYYALKWLLRNAYEASTPFYFWESARNGINFNSWKVLSDQDPYQTYEFRSFYENPKGTPEYYDEVQRRIISMSSPLNMSQFHQIGNGAYASTLYTFDIAEKKKEKFVYSYKPGSQLNKNEPYNTQETILDQTYDQLQNSKNYYISLNSKAFAESSNYHEPTKPTILKGEAHYYSTNFNTLNIQINGDFDLSTGYVVELDVSQVGSSEQNKTSRMKDKFFSGRYIVHRVKHTFEEQYRQEVTLKRDSIS